jgi:Tfp pilus assembly protein PilX
MKSPQRGATLAVGLILLALVTLLGLAGASAAHVERLLAQDERFRENAATAASAGIEMAIRVIVDTDPADLPAHLAGHMPGSADTYEVALHLAGYEKTLPQAPGNHLAGAHFDIVSTGMAAGNAVDRQRAAVMRVLDSADAAPTDCAPIVPRPCHARGALERISWQRVAVE